MTFETKEINQFRIVWRKPLRRSLIENADNPGALGEIDSFTCKGVHISALGVLTFDEPSIEIEAMHPMQFISIEGV